MKKKTRYSFLKDQENNNNQFEDFLKRYLERKSIKIPLIFSFSDYARRFFPFFNTQEKEKHELYIKGMQYIHKTVNYLSYIKLLQDMEKLKLILLKKEQITLFNYLSKPLLSIDKTFSEMSNSLEEINDQDKMLLNILHNCTTNAITLASYE